MASREMSTQTRGRQAQIADNRCLSVSREETSRKTIISGVFKSSPASDRNSQEESLTDHQPSLPREETEMERHVTGRGREKALERLYSHPECIRSLIPEPRDTTTTSREGKKSI
jgi:hypothetical protein